MSSIQARSWTQYSRIRTWVLSHRSVEFPAVWERGFSTFKCHIFFIQEKKKKKKKEDKNPSSLGVARRQDRRVCALLLGRAGAEHTVYTFPLGFFLLVFPHLWSLSALLHRESLGHLTYIPGPIPMCLSCPLSAWKERKIQCGSSWCFMLCTLSHLIPQQSMV